MSRQRAQCAIIKTITSRAQLPPLSLALSVTLSLSSTFSYPLPLSPTRCAALHIVSFAHFCLSILKNCCCRKNPFGYCLSYLAAAACPALTHVPYIYNRSSCTLPRHTYRPSPPPALAPLYSPHCSGFSINDLHRVGPTAMPCGIRVREGGMGVP